MSIAVLPLIIVGFAQDGPWRNGSRQGRGVSLARRRALTVGRNAGANQLNRWVKPIDSPQRGSLAEGSAARRRSDRNMGGLRGIDMFRKIPADLTSATTTGAILSVAACVEIKPVRRVHPTILH